MIAIVRQSRLLGIAIALAMPALALSPGAADASCVGAYKEYREGQREIASERREIRNAVRNAGSRKEARKEVREGMREIAKEKREQRREIRRELRPWC